MEYRDEDIDYTRFKWQRFEELCFDLLLKYQYYGLTWNKGGADGGRDIEARFGVNNPVTGFYEEKWYIECKHYTHKVKLAALKDKFAQADVEQIDHFLIITNNYLSRDTKAWIEKTKPTLKFKVHVLDGKNLNKKLLVFPELVAEYFADDTTRLVKDLYKQWLFHDSLPHIQTLCKLAKTIEAKHLSLIEMVFLVFVLGKLNIDFDHFDEDELEEFNFDFLIPFIAAQPTGPFPVLSKAEQEDHHIRYTLGTSSTTWPTWKGPAVDSQFFHDLRPLGEGELLEIYFERNMHKQLDLRVAVFEQTAK
ncbi:MAG: restriction endonuclease [Bacteroidota bacterium]